MAILIVDDEPDICGRVARLLQYEGIESVEAHNGLSAKRLLEQDVFSAVVTDLKMPGMDGLQLLQWIKDEGPEIPAIMMSAHGDIHDAVQAMKMGADDYIVKPFDPEELVFRLQRLLAMQRLHQQVSSGQQGEKRAVQSWIGESPSMQAMKTMIDKIAPTPSTVLITGESGTGKEVIARAVHDRSERASKPFIAINIGGVPENLLESELFGYEKGAFTGAAARKIGMFELAASGTLFLDEIGDMPMHLQIKLLRVLQERKIQRLGSTQSLPIDVRIITATNKHLEERIAADLFREDLYYRLKVIHLHLPPLRERQDDIPLLVGHFIQRYNSIVNKAVTGIEPEALAALQRYQFPGNIRELENMIERAIIMADGELIRMQDLDIGAIAPTRFEPRGSLDEIQKQVIHNALLRWEGNRTKAAEELGITRQTLRKKMRDYGLTDL